MSRGETSQGTCGGGVGRTPGGERGVQRQGVGTCGGVYVSVRAYSQACVGACLAQVPPQGAGRTATHLSHRAELHLHDK